MCALLLQIYPNREELNAIQVSTCDHCTLLVHMHLHLPLSAQEKQVNRRSQPVYSRRKRKAESAPSVDEETPVAHEDKKAKLDDMEVEGRVLKMYFCTIEFIRPCSFRRSRGCDSAHQ